MKRNHFQFLFGFSITLQFFGAQLLWGGTFEIPITHRTSFRLIPEGSESSSQTLTEHLSLGNKPITYLSLSEKKKVFLVGPPKADRCGMVQFSLENEQGETGHIYCIPDPFPRCGSRPFSKHLRLSSFLKEQIKNNAQCRMDVFLGSEFIESYEIQRGLSSSG